MAFSLHQPANDRDLSGHGSARASGFLGAILWHASRGHGSSGGGPSRTRIDERG